MRCQQVRNRILAVEEPSRLPDELAAHVDDCQACQAWQARFVAVELSLARMPVPDSDGLAKLAVLETIRAIPAPKTLAPPTKSTARTGSASAPITPLLSVSELEADRHAAPSPAAGVAKTLPFHLEDDLPKRKWSFGKYAANFWPAGLVAATLLIGAIALVSLRSNRPLPGQSSPPDPLLDHLVKLNVELAKTQAAAERVKILARVADELNEEMREIARADATGDNMRTLEKMYSKVVLSGLVDQARLVERSQREIILGTIVEGLSQSADKAEQMAKQAPQHSADSLNEVAGTARKGRNQIRRLIQEALL